MFVTASVDVAENVILCRTEVGFRAHSAGSGDGAK